MKDTIYFADIKSHRKGIMTGHYISVAENYREVLSERYNVIVAGCENFQNAFNEKELLKLPFVNGGNYKKEKIETILNSIYLFWKARGNIIVLQRSTPITSYICILLFFWFTSDLYLIQYDTESIKSWFGRFIWRLTKWKIKGVICPNKRIGESYGINYLVTTDYIFTKDYINHVPFNLRKWDFAAIGNITKDKGTLDIIEYLASKGQKILLAGRIAEPDLEDRLTGILSKYPNIEHHIGFVDKDNYTTYIRYSKYCLLNYSGCYNDRSSGIVLDIIFNGTPVLGSKCGALEFIEEYALGFLYSDYSEIIFEKLFNTSIYNTFLDNIANYGRLHLLYKNKLLIFLSKKNQQS